MKGLPQIEVFKRTGELVANVPVAVLEQSSYSPSVHIPMDVWLAMRRWNRGTATGNTIDGYIWAYKKND